MKEIQVIELLLSTINDYYALLTFEFHGFLLKEQFMLIKCSSQSDIFVVTACFIEDNKLLYEYTLTYIEWVIV